MDMIDYKTEEMLSNSIKEILRSKPLDKVTVAEIINNCNLSRPTFYRHFLDKYDLVNWTYQRDIKNIIDQYGDSRDFFELSVCVMNNIKKDRLYYKNVISDIESQNSFFKYWNKLGIDFMINQIGRNRLNDELRMAIDLYNYGTTFLIMNWLLNDMKETPEGFAKLMVKCMPEILKPYF